MIIGNETADIKVHKLDGLDEPKESATAKIRKL